MTLVDVIVAVRDEEQAIPHFLERIDALSLPQDVRVRVIFVEDSSEDGTIPLLRRLASERDGISYVSLEHGYGQGIAVSYGLSRSDADAMVMMDVDGSHPPETISQLVDAYLSGARAAQCVRRTLSDRKAYREWGASLFHLSSRLVFGVDMSEQNIFYRLVSQDVARMILAEPRYWRYLRFPLPREPEGATVFVPIDTAERVHGESKYDLWRLVNLAIDGVLSLMSRRRALILFVISALVGVGLTGIGHWVLALLVFGALAHFIARDRQLGRRDALERLEVLEEANLPAPT